MMPRMVYNRSQNQRGAALITAMLTVALVTTLASAALWQQWRQVEIEIAERGRSQTAWMMTGALDWARLILREDAISAQGAGMDHLGEPWAVPVQESKLSTFLSQDQQWREGDSEVFLSGHITDVQSRMNVMNLLKEGRVSPKAMAQFTALFERLNVPQEELQNMSQQLQATVRAISNGGPNSPGGSNADSAILPQRTDQLVWLGLRPASILLLQDHITILTEPTSINLNTASAEVLSASLPGLDIASARQAIEKRQRKPWSNLNDATLAIGDAARQLNDTEFSVKSRYFEIEGRMRIDNVVQQERTLVQRDGSQVRMLWRIKSPPQLLNTTLK